MIKESLNSLPSRVREQLMLAFEQGIQHIVGLEDGCYISVNMSVDILQKRGYTVLEEAGSFSYVKE